jgi:hydrogenase 3 maturation protease
MERRRTLPLSWNDSLYQKLNRLKRSDPTGLPRICLIGVGNDLRGDDSAGLIVARQLLAQAGFNSTPNLLILEGGPAPENQTGKLRAFRPELVLLIDAAHVDEVPGTVQPIPLESIDGMSASSHSLPLSMLARYIISEFDCEVEVLGIQPAQNEVDSELSFPVHAAVDEIVGVLVTFVGASLTL